MIYIGTGGYYYKSWVGEFYPSDVSPSRFFEFYAKKFNSLELNSTFYRIPKVTTVKSWKYRLKKHPGFKISVKANRSITHTYKLSNIEILKEFLKTVKYFGNCLGVVLFQLPPGLKYDIELLINFTKHLEGGLKYAFEFRNDSWYRIETYTHLKAKNIALVWHDYNQEFNFERTADFVYVRFHGSEGKYKGNYSEGFLAETVNKINGSNAYIYFNNTEDNSAFKDALKFKEMLENKI